MARTVDEGADDFRLLLTVTAAIALGVGATTLPALIVGPFDSWTYAARLVMWVTGIAAVLQEYLAVLAGSRLYLRRVEIVATTILALVFLAQAGMFGVIGIDERLLGSRWFAIFAMFNVFAALEAVHARRVIQRTAISRYGTGTVSRYVRSLKHATRILMITAAGAVGFVVFGHQAAPPVVFVAACVALASMMLANIQQHWTRAWLAREGIA